MWIVDTFIISSMRAYALFMQKCQKKGTGRVEHAMWRDVITKHLVEVAAKNMEADQTHIQNFLAPWKDALVLPKKGEGHAAGIMNE